MRVGLDVSPLRQTGAGTARHVNGLLGALAGRDGIEVKPLAFGGAGRLAGPVGEVDDGGLVDLVALVLLEVVGLLGGQGGPRGEIRTGWRPRVRCGRQRGQPATTDSALASGSIVWVME